jgi:DNA-binding response OmpR family regulator
VPVRVLVVEDARQLAGAIADGLRGQAMAVDVVFDGQAAQESLAVNDYDVVILDRDLPVVHGDEVCRSLAAGIRLDPVRHQASRHGRTLSLRHKEFLVLEELLRGGGAVVSAEQLLEKAWDENTDPFTHVVRVTIMTLRRKLGEPSPIETIPGAGYRIA